MSDKIVVLITLLVMAIWTIFTVRCFERGCKRWREEFWKKIKISDKEK